MHDLSGKHFSQPMILGTFMLNDFRRAIMAKNKKHTRKKGLPAAIISIGIIWIGYAALFSLNQTSHYVIAAVLSLLVGGLVYIMAPGLDTSTGAGTVEELPVTGDETIDGIVSRGQEMLAAIREENVKIPDETLSRQMDELDLVATRIFRTVIEQPGKAPQIRRFMDYYLPTTLKMIVGYRRLQERKVEGENAQAARDSISKAIGVVLKAFSKQLDTLFQDDMMDISTDIDVLETMLKQDGLVDSGLNSKAGEA
jgi:hypothetical protein